MLFHGDRNQNKHGTFIMDEEHQREPRLRPSPVWPAPRVEALIDLWNAGLATAEVARDLGATVRAVEGKLHKLRVAGRIIANRRRRPPARSKQAPRRCLYCSRMFASSHVGNRLCPACLEDGPFTGTLL